MFHEINNYSQEQKEECAKVAIDFLLNTFDTYLFVREELKDKHKDRVDEQITTLVTGFRVAREKIKAVTKTQDLLEDEVFGEFEKRIRTYDSTFGYVSTSEEKDLEEFVIFSMIRKYF